MSKKFLSLGLLLGSAALAVTAVATGTISLPFMATSVASIGDENTVDPTYTYPAEGQEIPSTEGLSTVTFGWPGDNDENRYVTINRQAGDITLSKDGKVIETISASNTDKVRQTNQYPNRILIDFTAQTEAGNYEVNIPAALALSADYTGGTEAVPEITFYNSSAYTLKCSVYEALSYNVAPALNSEVMAGDLAKITLTYPEGTTIKLNTVTAAPALYEYDMAGMADAEGNVVNKAFLTDCEASVNGNVITFTAMQPENITANSKKIEQHYTYLEIPKGLFTATKGSLKETNAKMNIEPWSVRAFVASSFKFNPANQNEVAIKGKDLEHLQIVFPSPVNLNTTVKPGTTTVGTFYQTGTPNFITPGYGTAYTFCIYKFESLSADGKVMQLTVDRINGSRYAYNFEDIESGYYQFSMYANILLADDGKTKNAKMDFAPFFVEGKDYALPNSIGCDNNKGGSNWFVDPFVESEKGFTYVMLTFPYKMNLNPDFDGKISVKKDGVVIKQVGAENFFSNAALTTAFANGKTSLYVKLTGEAFKVPGAYQVEFPEGFLTQAEYCPEPYPAGAYTVNVSVVDPVTYTVEPEGYTTNALAKAEDAETFDPIYSITVKYPEGYKLSRELDPSAGIKAYLAKGGYVDYHYCSSYVCNGNEITFEFENPVVEASPTPWALSVPAGCFSIESPEGATFSNLAISRYYRLADWQPGEINLVPGAPYDAPAKQLAVIFWTSPQDVYGFNDVFGDGGSAALYRQGDRTTPLVTYKGTIPEGGRKSVEWSAINTEILPFIEGPVEFVIPENAIWGGATEQTSTISIRNNSDFVFPFSLANILEQTITLTCPDESYCMPYETPSGAGLNQAMIGIDFDMLGCEVAQIPCEGNLELYYSNGGAEKLIKSVPADMGIMAMGWFSPLSVYLNFTAEDEMAAWDKDEEFIVPDMYKQPGDYRIVIPDGAFGMLVGEDVIPMLGTDVWYTLIPDADPDMNYVLTPEPGNYPEGELNMLENISITFPNAKRVSYTDYVAPAYQTAGETYYNPNAKLTTPSGEVVLSGSYPEISDDRRTITYNFSEPENGWEKGWYMFAVPEYSIAVNPNEFIWDYMKGNFKGFVTIYGVQDEGTSRVDLFGAEVADSYTIYTVSGQMVKVNGTVEDLAGLESGLYIINGKKVLVRK